MVTSLKSTILFTALRFLFRNTLMLIMGITRILKVKMSSVLDLFLLMLLTFFLLVGAKIELNVFNLYNF